MINTIKSFILVISLQTMKKYSNLSNYCVINIFDIF